MPGLVKIGFSTKDPEIRAIELNHTGTPHPYVVEYDVLVEDPRNVEQSLHKRLKSKQEGKEWFRCAPEEAVAAIQSFIGGSALLENYKRVDRYRAEALRHEKKMEVILAKVREAKTVISSIRETSKNSAGLAIQAASLANNSAKRAFELARKADEAANLGVAASKKLFRSQFHDHSSMWSKNARDVDWEGQGDYGVAIYRDGRRYEGGWKNNRRNGYGVCTWPNGSCYKGEWLNDNRNGLGVQTWPDGDRYEGYWLNGYRNGIGVYIWPGTGRYEGEFKNNKITGYGIRHFTDGARYEGEWSDDNRNRLGVQTWPSGDFYEGEFLDGYRNGYGIYIWPDKSYHIGEFRNNKIVGYGIRCFADEIRYEGEWQDGNQNGLGVQIWPKGSQYEGYRYEGEFLDGYRNGYGIYTWPNGGYFQGNWKDGKRNGDGVEFSPDGSILKAGFWQDGQVLHQQESKKSEEKDKPTRSNTEAGIWSPQNGSTKQKSYQGSKVKLTTSLGSIVFQLDWAKAPVSCQNFLDYVNTGFYNGTIFHRVIKGFMAQGGGFDTQFQQKVTRGPIKNEADNGLLNRRGSKRPSKSQLV